MGVNSPDLPQRIGHGFDVHRYADDTVPDAFITLCGCRIEHDRRLLAHSDGDVALHAVCDALLGSIAAGDIGQHFPDTDAAWENADSGDLLRRVYAMVQQAGYILGNLDITVIAQAPKLAPHIDSMKQRVAALLHCDTGAVNIKATTTEGLGYTGRSEGIAVHAVVIVLKNG